MRGNYLRGGGTHGAPLQIGSTATIDTLTANTIVGEYRPVTLKQDYPTNAWFDLPEGGPNTPTGTRVFVRPNRYEPKRAHVIVYNYDRLSAVAVNLSQVLNVGDSYRIRDVQNYYGSPVDSGTYQGGTITLPLTQTSVSRVIGGPATQPTHTDNNFATFVVEPLYVEGRLAVTPEQLSPEGGDVLVEWDSRNATNVRIEPLLGNVGPAGAKRVVVKATTVFTLLLSNSNGEIWQQAVVRVPTSGPVLLSPPDGQTGGVPPLKLIWQAVGDGSLYRVIVSLDSLLRNPSIDSSVVDTVLQLQTLRGLSMYYWQVMALSRDGSTTFSRIRRFRTNLLPPQLLSPPDGAIESSEDPLQLDWESVDGASAYRLLLSTDSTFRAAVLLDTSITSSTFRLSHPMALGRYWWLVQGISADESGPSSAPRHFDMVAASPSTSFSLQQNYPNPFNPSTTIRFELPSPARVALSIHSIDGRIVRTLVDANLQAGVHEIDFDASGLATGPYFYQLQAGSFRDTRKLLLLR